MTKSFKNFFFAGCGSLDLLALPMLVAAFGLKLECEVFYSGVVVPP